MALSWHDLILPEDAVDEQAEPDVKVHVVQPGLVRREKRRRRPRVERGVRRHPDEPPGAQAGPARFPLVSFIIADVVVIVCCAWSRDCLFIFSKMISKR